LREFSNGKRGEVGFVFPETFLLKPKFLKGFKDYRTIWHLLGCFDGAL